MTFKGTLILTDISGKNLLKSNPNRAGIMVTFITSQIILIIGKDTSVWLPINACTAQLDNIGMVSNISRLLMAVRATAKAVSALIR